jgi:polyhydroxyalkanoate synthesis regulator phasin
MKQTFTIENELAMIIDLLTGMVENGSIKLEEADKIIEEFLEMQNNKSSEMLPGKNVINNIMNYSKSIDVFKHLRIEPTALIVN